MTSTAILNAPREDASALSQARVALVVTYSDGGTFEALSRRFSVENHVVTLLVDQRARFPGAPKSSSIDAQDRALCIQRDLMKKNYDYAVFVDHPFIGAEEVADALRRLKMREAPIHYLIPGLNELLTLGTIALAAYSLRWPDISFPNHSLGVRVRRALAPHLPQPVKTAIRTSMRTLGILSPFGFTPEAPVGQAARISTQKSVAWVLERENPGTVPCTYDLGSKVLQKKFFVEEVGVHFPLPTTINLVLSNQCNLKCVMCPYHSPLFLDNRQTDYFDDKRWMPLPLVERLAGEIAQIKHPDTQITFHMGQLDEPLMHPKVADIVRVLAAVPNATVHITSNGNLMNDKLARAVIRNGLKSIQFSVDAHTQETYKKIRGASLAKVQRNVRRFLQLRDEINPDLYVNICIINQAGASEEIEAFKAYWREQGVSSVSVYQLFVPSSDNAAKWVAPNKYFEEKRRTPCTALWDQCFVYPEGEVSLCCTTLGRVPQDGIIATGNFNQQSLSGIWLGAAYQRIRENLIFERLEDQKYCEECDNWSSSYQYKKKLEDGTDFVFGESMGYYYFPKSKSKKTKIR